LRESEVAGSRECIWTVLVAIERKDGEMWVNSIKHALSVDDGCIRSQFWVMM